MLRLSPRAEGEDSEVPVVRGGVGEEGVGKEMTAAKMWQHRQKIESDLIALGVPNDRPTLERVFGYIVGTTLKTDAEVDQICALESKNYASLG